MPLRNWRQGKDLIAHGSVCRKWRTSGRRIFVAHHDTGRASLVALGPRHHSGCPSVLYWQRLVPLASVLADSRCLRIRKRWSCDLRSASLGRAIQPTGQSFAGLGEFPVAACFDLLIAFGSTRGQVKRLPPTHLPLLGRLDLLLHIATRCACCALAHCTQYAQELVVPETATVSVPLSVGLTSRCLSTPLFESVSSSIPNCSTDCSHAD